MKTVGLIGLGAMGSGMAASLRRAKFPLRVFDVRPDVVQAFVKRGGHGL
jgi:putative dehydrogenase